MCHNASMAKFNAVLLAAVLSFAGFAQEETLELRGEAPPELPEGAVVEAMMYEDLTASAATVPLVRGEVLDGSFSVILPEKLESDLLQDLRLVCVVSHAAVIVPYLQVLEGDEVIGQFWRTDLEDPGAWGISGPWNSTQLVYVDEAFAAEDDCWGDLYELDFEPGWNHYSRIVTDSGSLTTTADPPVEFVWRYLPLR